MSLPFASLPSKMLAVAHNRFSYWAFYQWKIDSTALFRLAISKHLQIYVGNIAFADERDSDGPLCVGNHFWALRVLVPSDRGKTTFSSSCHQGLLRRESRNRSD